MKKLLSGILALGMLISNMAFGVAEAATPEYIASDDSYRVNNVFLSEGQEPGVANKEYDWFEKNSDNNKRAIDWKSMLENVDKNGWWMGSRGTPYKLDLQDNGKGAHAANGITAYLPYGYYSKVRVLVAQSTATQWGAGGNYRLETGDGGATVQYENAGTWNTIAGHELKNTPKLLNVESGVAIATDETAQLWEFTITLKEENKIKKFSKLWFTRQNDSTWKGLVVLGVTGVSLSGDEWIPAIKAELADVLKNPSADKITEIQSIIEKAKADGVSTDSIEGMAEFEELLKAVVSIKDWKSKCDSQNITLDINFTGAISAESVTADNFKVSTGDEVNVEPIYENEDIMGVRLVMKNRLNYKDSIQVTVSGNVKSAGNSGMTLGKDFTFEFTPTAPGIYIDSADVIKETGSAKVNITLKNNAGEEKPYALIVGVYDKNGMMKGKKIFGGTLTTSLKIPGFNLAAADDDIVEIYLMDSFKDRNLLSVPVIFNDSTDEELMATLQAPKVCEFYQNKSGAYSLTFDDGEYASNVFYSDVLGNYGFKGTAMIIAEKMVGTVEEWQSLLDKGNIDIGNHSAKHEIVYSKDDITDEQLEADINGAYEKLKENFPGQDLLTFASPWGETSEASVSKMGENHYANRLVGGGVNSANPTDYMKLKSYLYNGSTANDMNKWADAAISEKGWSIALLHNCIDGDKGAELAIGKGVFREHVKYLDTQKDKLWIASYNDVTAYLKEKQNASISIISANEDRMILSVTDTLPDDRFHQPLTLEVNVPNSWTRGARFSQGDVQGESVVTRRNGEKLYVQIDAVPDNGYITLYKK